MKSASSPAQNWLRDNLEFLAICGGLLSIIHPELYELGAKAIQRLSDDPRYLRDPEHLQDALRYWIVPFSGVAIISQRETPTHRDVGCRPNWYDLLTTLGEYEGATMRLPDLGYCLQYESGTMIGLCARVIRHGVEKQIPGRVCVSLFVRDNVLDRLGVEAGTWRSVKEL